jgi:hypothetical protein
MTKLSRLIVMVMALLVLAAGCGGGDSAGVPTSRWATISGRHVSLSVPTVFTGGDPEDPAVMSFLRGIAESRPDPEERKSLIDWLDVVKAGADQSAADTPSLIAWFAPNDAKRVTSVTVSWSPLQDLLVASNGDSSMGALVNAYMMAFDEQYWKLDSLATQGATVVIRYGSAGEGAPAELRAIKVVGNSYYTVRYACPEESWDAWYPVFRRSSQTLDLIP